MTFSAPPEPQCCEVLIAYPSKGMNPMHLREPSESEADGRITKALKELIDYRRYALGFASLQLQPFLVR